MAEPAQTPPDFHADLPGRLAEAGWSPPAAEALLALDAAMFHWHRWSAKGELPRAIIAELGLDLDLSQFHAMTAITRITHGVGRAAPEPATVGLLAEEMAIDPSRASRIASGLIEAGYLRREVAQADGRKVGLALTPRARAVFLAFRDRKWSKMLDIFADWPEDDVLAFARLFARYGEGLRRVYLTEG